MEIKSKARVAAKSWPALSDASGRSPRGQRAQRCPAEMGNGSNWASFLPAPVKAGQARLCLSPLVYEGSGALPERNINFSEGRRQLQFLDNTCSSFFCTQDESSWVDSSAATHDIMKPAVKGYQSVASDKELLPLREKELAPWRREKADWFILISCSL